MPETFHLSPKHARKLVLLSQCVYSEAQFGRGIAATLKAIEQLGYIQIDTISVVERAHHHTLWNRVNNYQAKHLDVLQRQGKIFEYWSHAAAYLPMRDFRFSLPRKRAIANGERHWYNKDPKLAKLILKRIEQEGPLQAKDFQHSRKTKAGGWWDWKPAKQQLEQLFMEGELMVAHRQGFQKVYDLTERILPADVDTHVPSDSKFYQHLIERYLNANGLGNPAAMAYLRKGLKSAMHQRCQQMLEAGQLVTVKVGAQHYYALANFERQLKKRISRSRVKILSPFDNLVIQRQRLKDLFNFEYQIECYVPAAKRKHGYFCLPLLWGDKFPGRMDAKIDRKTNILSINHLHLETSKPDEFFAALKPALVDFMKFNNGQGIVIKNISGHKMNVQKQWQKELDRQTVT